MLLYLYDLKVKVHDYNRLKRRFYYQLGRSELSSQRWKTKSALVVSDDKERLADSFFRRWKPHIEVFKVRVEEIEEL